jgi:hypothetical protein
MAAGIHGAHVGPGIAIKYATDSARKNIHWIRYSDSNGVVAEYASEGWDAGTELEHELRDMDCLDCHTRPSHQFQMPERALDEAMALGKVDPTLPWIRKAGRELLEVDYASGEEAAEQIAANLTEFYRTEFPAALKNRRSAIQKSAEGLVDIYRHNVFPEMRVRWGTYPDFSGHTDFVGCFRCHGGGQLNADGRSIPAECTTCHRLLAVRESEPAILEQLGLIR